MQEKSEAADVRARCLQGTQIETSFNSMYLSSDGVTAQGQETAFCCLLPSKVYLKGQNKGGCISPARGVTLHLLV